MTTFNFILISLQGNTTEHSFHGDLQQLIDGLLPDTRATNEPKRRTCGPPDYILTKRNVPVGFIEAKNIDDDDLDGANKTENKEQFDRHKALLSNILFTDYLDFHLVNTANHSGNPMLKLLSLEETYLALAFIVSTEMLHNSYAQLKELFPDRENLLYGA